MKLLPDKKNCGSLRLGNLSEITRKKKKREREIQLIGKAEH